MFPPHIEELFNRFGVRADTKAAMYDLYVSLGAEALEVFGDLVDRVGEPSHVAPGDLVPIRSAVIDRYVRKNHASWLEGRATASLWHPRSLEGRAAGAVFPLGEVRSDTGDGIAAEVARMSRAALDENQPVPEGLLLLGKNAHYGGRDETVSFDVEPLSMDDALAVARAEGQQHTIPGSVGETSGTLDAIHSVALIWEVQPNVRKPSADKNAEIREIYRRHRNWHVTTLIAALRWFVANQFDIFILKGSALRPTHEVNREKPVTEAIEQMHDRTVASAVNAAGMSLREITPGEAENVEESSVMNTGLRKHVSESGATVAMWRVVEKE